MIKLIILLINFSRADVIIGEAFVDGKLAYIEKHAALVDPSGKYLTLKTDYYANDNKSLIASIISDFNKNSFVPDVVFKDYRFDIEENVSYSQTGNSVEVVRSIKNKKTNYKIKLENPSILGQGFHNYIIAHFDKLMSDKDKVNIVVTAKKDFYNFRIEKKKSTADYVELVVYPSNFLLKQIVSPIELKYSLKDKRLLNFRGLSNLDDPKGNEQVVDIRYKYDSSPGV